MIENQDQLIRNIALDKALMYPKASNSVEETLADAAKYEKFLKSGKTD